MVTQEHQDNRQPGENDRQDSGVSVPVMLLTGLSAVALLAYITRQGGSTRNVPQQITPQVIDRWVRSHVRFADNYSRAHAQELRDGMRLIIMHMPPEKQVLVLQSDVPVQLGSFATIRANYSGNSDVGGFFQQATNQVWIGVGNEGQPLASAHVAQNHAHEWGHKFSYNGILDAWPRRQLPAVSAQQSELLTATFARFSNSPQWREAFQREQQWRVGRQVISPITTEFDWVRGVIAHTQGALYANRPLSHPEEALAQLGAIYDRIYAARGGNWRQVDAFMSISYPELWPVYLAEFHPLLQAHAQQISPGYRVTPIEPLSLPARAADDLGRVQPWLEREGWGRNVVAEAYGPHARSLRIPVDTEFTNATSRNEAVRRIDLPGESYLVVDDARRLRYGPGAEAWLERTRAAIAQPEFTRRPSAASPRPERSILLDVPVVREGRNYIMYFDAGRHSPFALEVALQDNLIGFYRRIDSRMPAIITEADFLRLQRSIGNLRLVDTAPPAPQAIPLEPRFGGEPTDWASSIESEPVPLQQPQQQHQQVRRPSAPAIASAPEQVRPALDLTQVRINDDFAALSDRLIYLGPLDSDFDPASPRTNATPDWQRTFPSLSPQQVYDTLRQGVPSQFDTRITVFGPYAPSERASTRSTIEAAMADISRLSQSESLSPEFLEAMDPARMAANLERMNRTFGNVNFMMQVTRGDQPVGQFQFALNPETHAGVLDVFTHRGSGLSRPPYAGMLQLADQLQVRTLHMNFAAGQGGVAGPEGLVVQDNMFNNGLYTALRVGATPSDWDALRTELSSEFARIRPHVSNPQTVATMEAALASSDPRAAWVIADAADLVVIDGERTRLGRALLVGRVSEGALDIAPGSEARARLEQYIRPLAGPLEQQPEPVRPAQRQEGQQQQQRNGEPRQAAPAPEEIRLNPQAQEQRAQQEETQRQIRARREAQNPNPDRPHSEFDPVQPLPEPAIEPHREPMGPVERPRRHNASPMLSAEESVRIAANQRAQQERLLAANQRTAQFEHVMSPQEFAAQFSAERTMPPAGSGSSTRIDADTVPMHASRVFAQGDPAWLRYEQGMRLYLPHSQIHTVILQNGDRQFFMMPEQLAHVQSIDAAPSRPISDAALADRLVVPPLNPDSGYIRVDDLNVGERLAVINGLEERGIRTTGYLEIPSRPGVYFHIDDGNYARVQILRSIGMGDIAPWQEVRFRDIEARLGMNQSALTEEVRAGLINFQRGVAELGWARANRGFQVMTLPENAARTVETLRQSGIRATMETTGSRTRVFVDEVWTVALNDMRAAYDQPPLDSPGVRNVSVSGYGGQVPQGITVEIPSTARLNEFSLHRLSPSTYGENEIIFNRPADIAELSRRIGLDIPADQIRTLRVTTSNGRLGLNVMFNSFDAEQRVLENGGIQRLEAAARNLEQRGRSLNFSAPNPLQVTLPEAPRIGPSSLLSDAPLARMPGSAALADITIAPITNSRSGAFDITGRTGGPEIPHGLRMPNITVGPGVGLGMGVLGVVMRHTEGGSMERAQQVGGEQLRTENIAARADFAVAIPDAALITTNTVVRQVAPTLAARVAPGLIRALGPVSILAAAGWTAAEMQAARAAQDGRREASALYGFLGGVGAGFAGGAGGGAAAGPWGALIGGAGGAVAGGYMASEAGRSSALGDQMQRNLDRSAQRVVDLAVIRLQQMDRTINNGGELNGRDRNDLRTIIPAMVEQMHRLRVLPLPETDIDGQLRRGFQIRQIQQALGYVQAADARAAAPPLTSQQASAQAAQRLPAILREINNNPQWRQSLDRNLTVQPNGAVTESGDGTISASDVLRTINRYSGLELYMLDRDGSGLTAPELVDTIAQVRAQSQAESRSSGGGIPGSGAMSNMAGYMMRNAIAGEVNSSLDSPQELEAALDGLHIPGLTGERLRMIMSEYGIRTTSIDPDGNGVLHEGHLLAAFDAAGVPRELLTGLADDLIYLIPDRRENPRRWDVTEDTLGQLRDVVESDPAWTNPAMINEAREIARIYYAEGGTRAHAQFQFTRFGTNRPRNETLEQAGFQRVFDLSGDGHIDNREFDTVSSRLRLRPTDLNGNSRFDPFEIYRSLPPEERAKVDTQRGTAWLQQEQQRLQQIITPAAPPPEPESTPVEAGEITRTNSRQSDLLQAITPRLGRQLAQAGLQFDLDQDGTVTRGEFLSCGRDLGEDLSRFNHSLPREIVQRLKDRNDEQGRS